MARFLLDLLFTVIAVRVVLRLHTSGLHLTYLLLNVVTFFLASSANRRSVWGRPLVSLRCSAYCDTALKASRFATSPTSSSIGVALLNALANDQVSLVELVTVNDHRRLRLSSKPRPLSS